MKISHADGGGNARKVKVRGGLGTFPGIVLGGTSDFKVATNRLTVAMAEESSTCCGVNLAFATVGLKVEIVFLEWTWAVTFGGQTADRFIDGGGGGGVFCLLWGEPGLRYGGGVRLRLATAGAGVGCWNGPEGLAAGLGLG